MPASDTECQWTISVLQYTLYTTAFYVHIMYSYISEVGLCSFDRNPPFLKVLYSGCLIIIVLPFITIKNYIYTTVLQDGGCCYGSSSPEKGLYHCISAACMHMHLTNIHDPSAIAVK